MTKIESRDGESLDEGGCSSVGRLKNWSLEVKLRALWNRRALDFCLKKEAEEGLSTI